MEDQHVMDMGEDDVRAELFEWIRKAGVSEMRILLYAARRWIGLGQRAYGRLRLDGSDGRDWRKERCEESTDWAFYDLCASFEARSTERGE